MTRKIKLTRLLIVSFFVVALLPSILISILLLNDHYHDSKKAVISEMDGNLNAVVNEFLHKFNADAMNINLLVAERSLYEGIEDILVTEDAFNQISHFHKLSTLSHSTYLLASNFSVVENINGVIKRFENSSLLANIKAEINRKPLIKGEQIIFIFNDAQLLSKLIQPGQSSSGYAIIAPIFNQALLYQENMIPTGYLVSLSSFQEVLEMANYKSKDLIIIGEKSSIYAVNSPDEYSLNQFQTLSSRSKMDSTALPFLFQSTSSRNELNLTLSSHRAHQSLSDIIAGFMDTLALGVVVTFLFSLLVSVIVVRWLNQPFIWLGDIITSFQHGDYRVRKATNLRFRELQEIVRLLDKMGAQINKQITTLKNQNIELSTVSDLKDRYLSELHTLNSELEHRVEEQTLKISKSLLREEENRILLQELVAVGVKLQKSASMEQVLDVSLSELTRVFPQKAIVVETHPDFEVNYQGTNAGMLNQFFTPNQPVIWPKIDALAKQSLEFADKKCALFYIADDKDECIGLIAIEDIDFGTETREILNLFARQMGAIIKNIQLYQEVERLARVDALTGIGNRKAFNDAFTKLSNHRQRYVNEHYGLFMIDINGLKPINDRYGHKCGDLLICSLSAFLEDTIRDTDQVFRLAGDEFAIIVKNGTQQSCESLYNRMLSNLKGQTVCLPLEKGAKLNTPLSFSCGYASTETTETNQLFTVADELMYERKKQHYDEESICV